jgi:glutathione S-transferase
MKLYSAWYSPFSQRAWLALVQQNIEVKFIEHRNESRTHDFRSLTNGDAL